MVRPEPTTARLRLRRVSMDDLHAFVALETALRTRDGRGAPDPAKSADYLADFVRVWEDGDLGYWTVRQGEHVVGFGGVRPKPWQDRRCWNLYYRVDPARWGQGIATEVSREAVAAAGTVRPEWPVLVETRPSNTAAIRVAEQAGLLRQDDLDGYAVLLLEFTA
ncbi:RimJ/RimL family protein N-acetyltransferase [Saccharothrix tamanrassetensis]|uniref:RimJ/RimL family protein N-acetyltransferase n=1 Tax=Saccharothrix tamanrassetensis TaxID=1051531 RepID=A0A841CPX7_9PSEU|nr:GNAT family N-acetyltransferase [Saccharothrix tamanrassetensis]MBB5958127.1 RimJ/RimL family protein N-acetyltransferase [Saccharothrix tamanrassetensis]